jgi:hypothetical protein
MNPVLRQLLFSPKRTVIAVNTVTWNPSDFTTGSFSNANLTFTTAGTNGGVRATHSSNKKKYFECTIEVAGSFSIIGFETITAPLGGQVPADSGGGGSWYYSLSQILYGANGSSSISSMPSGTAGDICGFALDHDRKLFWVHKNGVWMNSGDPASGADGIAWGTSAVMYPALRPESGGSITLNAGATAFAYAPPTGFYAWREIDG